MDESRPIPVGVAEYEVSRDERPLRTTGVGSCVVVVLHDETSLVSGLLHFMLPESGPRPDEEAKFADSGIEALASALETSGGDPDRVWAKLAGGATMVPFESFDRPIGQQNAEAAHRVLGARGIPIRAADTGGASGRRVTFYPSTGDLHVRPANGRSRRI